MQNRREFIKTSASAGILLSTYPELILRPDSKDQLWYNSMRRCAQHNLNEYDPKILDIDYWVNFWKELKLDALVITAGGFIAMYPTKLPWHHKSQFLGNRDLFGEYSQACKNNGIRVVARIETNWAHEEILKARPEWFERNKDGSPRPNPETPWVFRTCLFSDYRHIQIPKIARELINLYDVDGIFTNSWPDAGNPYLCECENCKMEKHLDNRELHEKFLDRKLEICRILNSVVKEKRKDCVYNINIAGSIGATQNLKKIGDIAEWVNADHQSRGGHTAIWDCSQQGRVAYSIMKGKPVTNAVGTKTGPWRHSTNSEPEITMWLAQTLSSGMIPWLIWLGGELPDRRWQAIGKKYFNWLARNERHFINKRSLARIGVVFSQRLNEYYNAPGKIPAGYGTAGNPPIPKGNPTDYLQGLYYTLLEGRFLFDFIHETDLKSDTLKQYSSLILPNIALMDDEQIGVLHDYVNSGGSILATFETGLYNEWGEKRPDHPLGDIFDFKLKPGYTGPVGQIFYMSVDQKHEITDGFGDTDQLPGGEYHIPVEANGDHLLTIIPPYPNGVPEMVYPYSREEMSYPGKCSNYPGIIIREKGRSRLVYLPIDIDRNIWTQGSTDLSELLKKAIRWMVNGKDAVKIAGNGNIEIFAWETEAGYALHILNYNNPNMTFPSLRQFDPIGEQSVIIEMPEGVRIIKAELLSAGSQIPVSQKGNIIQFVIPSVVDFEVVALYV